MSSAELTALFSSVDVDRLRRGRSTKWSTFAADVLPAWVADMDFDPPPAVLSGLQGWLDDRFLGYPGWPYHKHLHEVASRHLSARFGMVDDPARFLLQTDVVQGMHAALQVWSKPGEQIFVLTPIYPPFLSVLREQGRRLLEYRMEIVDGEYCFDRDALRALIAANLPPMLLLCNPHNPVGRVFTESELRCLAELALEFDMVVVSDEIHAELIFDGRRHVAFETLSDEVRAHTVTITSASKSCNLAGLRTAMLVFGAAELKAQFDAVFSSHILGVVSYPGMLSMEIAWSEQSVAAWLRCCVSALSDRRDQFAAGLSTRVPEAVHIPSQGTYLAWVDLSALGLRLSEFGSAADRLRDEAKVAFSAGPTFGEGLEHFVRVNLATSPALVDEMLDRLGGWVDAQRA